MKKLLTFLIALCLLTALCGCSGQKETGESETGSKPGTHQGSPDADEETYNPDKKPVSIHSDGSN